MQVVVTGGTGFVGRHLVPHLIQEGHDVTVLHRKGLPVPEGLDATIVEGDLLDPSTLDFSQAEAVIHMAAQSSPQRCEEDPAGAVKANVLGTQHVLDAFPGGRFVFMSSGQVYAPTSKPISEAAPVGPFSRYGATKLAAEVLVRNAGTRPDIEPVILRAFNMYGPGQEGPFLIPDLVRSAKQGRIRLQSASPVRDFLFVEDAVHLIAKTLEQPQAIGETFNVASGKSVSIRELAQTAGDVAGIEDVSFERDEGRTTEADEVHVDISHAREFLGWKPETELRAGLTKTLQPVL